MLPFMPFPLKFPPKGEPFRFTGVLVMQIGEVIPVMLVAGGVEMATFMEEV